MIIVSGAVAEGAARLNGKRAHGGAGADVCNAEPIGRVLYTDYVYYFQAAGMVLLVAMIGAIVLTLTPQARRQAPGSSPTRCAHAAQDRHANGPRQDRRGDRSSVTIGLPHYLAVAAILFTIGVFGIFVNRKNVIVILMSIEMILLAVNINWWPSRSICTTSPARSSPCSC